MKYATRTCNATYGVDRTRSSATVNGTPTSRAVESARDCSGFAVFADGELGRMHVHAHEAFDNRAIESGHRELGSWLASHTGSGSDWVHLQFHMAVFELALGDWDAAYTRFMHEILPVAVTTALALTDAPALLWRLEITAPRSRRLPWRALHAMAEQRIEQTTDSFTVLHQLLVLAGAGDATAITEWRRAQRTSVSSLSGHVLDRVADALTSIACCDYAAAACGLREIAPKLPHIGGSFAQNDLFRQLEQWCLQRSTSGDALRPARLVA